MGNSIQHLAEGITLFASAKTWIEGNAIQQLQHSFQLPGMHRIVGMPDLHPGLGHPVGAAFFSVGRLYPALIGNDIGCGMSLWRTSLESHRLSPEKIEKRLGCIDDQLDEDWNDRIASLGLPETGFESSLGTIGGGNHFAELQQIDAVHSGSTLSTLGIDKKRLLLLVHSGSRGLGQKILSEHVDRFNHKGLAEASDECAEYLDQHAKALGFAKANRHLIAQRFFDRLRCSGAPIIDAAHNFLAPAIIAGTAGWLHRKGVAPADGGPLVIPGSRGDYSYLVEPMPDEDSLFSVAHGAGRKWMRGECRDRVSTHSSAQQLLRTSLGSRVVCANKHLLFEEAPEAYKSVESVIESLQDAGLIRLIARMKPVLTYKTGREVSR